jgi:hypothetical protein
VVGQAEQQTGLDRDRCRAPQRGAGIGDLRGAKKQCGHDQRGPGAQAFFGDAKQDATGNDLLADAGTQSHRQQRRQP